MPKAKAKAGNKMSGLAKAVTTFRHKEAPRHEGQSKVLDFRTAAATAEFSVEELKYNHAEKKASTKSGMKTILGSESHLNVDRRLRNASYPIGAIISDDANVEDELSLTAFQSTGEVRQFMPKRPSWTYEVSSGRLHHREVQGFKQWLGDVRQCIVDRGGYPPAFEQNIQVWRQLWRVLERCDVAVVVVDARHPLLHLPPSLLYHVARTLKKPLVVVLNKLDAVEPCDAVRWAEVLRAHVPGIARVVGFSKEGLRQEDFEGLPVGRCALIGECHAAVAEHRKLREVASAEARAEARRRAAEEKDVLKVGSKVILVDLVGAKHLNGQNGQCESLDAENGRWVVILESGDKKSLKPENLYKKAGDIAQFHPDPSATPQEGSGARRVMLGMVGHPNVGKSSLINSIMGEKVVSVKATPGHTKTLQTLSLDDETFLCDSPGVVFPRLEVPREAQIVGMLIPLAQVREPFSAIRWVMEHCKEPLPLLLGLKPVKHKRVEELRENGTDALRLDAMPSSEQEDMPWSPLLLCAQWATQRGLTRGGRLDVNAAGVEILERVLDGRVSYAVLPPSSEEIDKTDADACWAQDGGSQDEDDWGIDEDYESAEELERPKDLFEAFDEERRQAGSRSIASRKKQDKKLKQAALAGETPEDTARRLDQRARGIFEQEIV